jgi:hypothetical protein
MTEEAMPDDDLPAGQHAPNGGPIPPRIVADRHTFITAPNDWVDLKELKFLGFTRIEWIYAGAPLHYLGYNNLCPHPDLLILCGMAEAVERWRREAASEYEGEHGPIPEFWNMPDLIARWELMNPDIVAAHAAHEAKREREQNEENASWQREIVLRDEVSVWGR